MALSDEERIIYIRPKYLIDELSFVIEGRLKRVGEIGPYSFMPGTEIVAYAQSSNARIRCWFLRHEGIDGYVDGTQTLSPTQSAKVPNAIVGRASDWLTDSAVNPRALVAGQPSAEPEPWEFNPTFVANEARRSYLHFKQWSAWRAFYGVPEPTELTPYYLA